LWGVAWLAHHQGDDEAAAAAGRELAVLAEEEGDELTRRNALTIAGMVAIAGDRVDEAIGVLGEALELAHRVNAPWILATSMLNLALADLSDGGGGAVAEARSLLGDALACYESIGDRRFRARCLGYLGVAALLENDADRAQALFRQSLTVFRDLEEPGGMAEALSGLAAVAAASGRSEEAARLAGAGERVRQTVGARELPLERRIAERYLGPAAEILGPSIWAEAWREGVELATEVAVTLALGG
jgi:tetratricopeptide (TPR) repeat protein